MVALQQALAMMQMENMLENGPTEETGTKQKSGIPTVARYPYFIYGVEISVLISILLFSFETLENSILFQDQRNCVSEFNAWTSTPAKYLCG